MPSASSPCPLVNMWVHFCYVDTWEWDSRVIEYMNACNWTNGCIISKWWQELVASSLVSTSDCPCFLLLFWQTVVFHCNSLGANYEEHPLGHCTDLFAASLTLFFLYQAYWTAHLGHDLCMTVNRLSMCRDFESPRDTSLDVSRCV